MAIAKQGHNAVGGVDTEHLTSIIDRIERLEEEKAGIADAIKDVITEAKGNGFDAKTIRKILAARKLRAEERAEQEHLFALYARALGMSVEELDASFD